MVHISEIRVGSTVTDFDRRILTVDEIRRVGVRCLYKGLQNTEAEGVRNSLFAYDEIYPVELTAELLQEFGFDFIPELIAYCSKHHCVYERADFFTIHPFCTNDEDCHVNVKYLHELENWIFATETAHSDKAK